METRQRRRESEAAATKAASAATADDRPVETLRQRRAREKAARVQRGHPMRDTLLVFGTLAMVALIGCGYLVHRLGWWYLVPKKYKMLQLSPSEVAEQISKHKVLFIGGPHRGGTTMLWKALRTHPEGSHEPMTSLESLKPNSLISGFPDKIGADYSEGMFIQSVYPNFGIGSEAPAGGGGGAKGGRAKAKRGLGRYALNDKFHLKEDTQLLQDPSAQATIFNEWGFFWDLEKPVLLEKSPPNMIISRFLQSLFTVDDDTSAYFLFITRHPIANSLALSKWTGLWGLTDVYDLVQHWVVASQRCVDDMAQLKSSAYIKYEDYVADPVKHLGIITKGLGVGNFSQFSLDAMEPLLLNTNAKYERQYCQWVEHSTSNLAKHQRMVDDFEDAVQDLGYSLNSFACLQPILERLKRA